MVGGSRQHTTGIADQAQEGSPMTHIDVKRGDIVRLGGGNLASVVEPNARLGRAHGIRVMREHSQNYYLDKEGTPRVTPAQYSEFIQDGFYQLERPYSEEAAR